MNISKLVACKRQLVVSDVSNSSTSRPTRHISKASWAFPLCRYLCLCDVRPCAVRCLRVCWYWYYFSYGYEQLLLSATHVCGNIKQEKSCGGGKALQRRQNRASRTVVYLYFKTRGNPEGKPRYCYNYQLHFYS